MASELKNEVSAPEVQAEPRPPVNAGMRRSGRIAKQIPIILSGPDVVGRYFSEETKTLLLSLHGASVLSRHKLVPEQELFLRMVTSGRETEVRICGEIGEREDGHIYGVSFVDSKLDFWGIEFPPPERLTKDLIPFTLECTGCHRQSSVQMDATELDVYAVNEGALRYCSHCAASTVWKITAEAAPVPPPEPSPKPVEIAPVSPPTAEPDLLSAAEVLAEPPTAPACVAVAAAAPSAPTPPAPVNRRSERRMRARCNACVRVPGMKDEVVPCEDLSKGGFSFHSTRTYGEETILDVAVPYTLDSAGAIFVPGQVVNVSEIQKGKLWRYGVAYLRKSKT